MKVKNIVISILAAGMMSIMSMSVMAAERVSIYLPANQVWTTKEDNPVKRKLDSDVFVRCDSVYPAEGTDNGNKNDEAYAVVSYYAQE